MNTDLCFHVYQDDLIESRQERLPGDTEDYTVLSIGSEPCTIKIFPDAAAEQKLVDCLTRADSTGPLCDFLAAVDLVRNDRGYPPRDQAFS